MVRLKDITSLTQLNSELNSLQFTGISKTGGRKFSYGDSNVSLNTFIRKVESLCKRAAPAEIQNLGSIITKIKLVDADANRALLQRFLSAGKSLKLSVWWRNTIGNLIYNKEKHLKKLEALVEKNPRFSKNNLTVAKSEDSSLAKGSDPSEVSDSVRSVAEVLIKSSPTKSEDAPQDPKMTVMTPSSAKSQTLVAARTFKASALTGSLTHSDAKRPENVDLTRSLPIEAKKRKITKESPTSGSMTKKEESKLKALLTDYASNKAPPKGLKKAKTRQYIDHTNFFRGSSDEAVQATKNQWKKGLSDAEYIPWNFSIVGELEAASEYSPEILLLMKELPQLTEKVKMSLRIQQTSSALYSAADKIVQDNLKSKDPGIKTALQGVLVSFLQTQVTPFLQDAFSRESLDPFEAAKMANNMVIAVTDYCKDAEKFAEQYPDLKVQLDNLSKALLPGIIF